MSNVLRILVAFAVFSAGAGYSQTAIKYVNKCEYSIQINEGNQVLTLLEGRVSGRIDTCHCFDIHYLDVCRIDEKNRILSTRELGRKSFKNSKGENCFLDNLTLGIGSDDCSGSCRWFSGISYKISCEEPASIPDKCGKSKNYASQVILENSRAECDSLGGKFEGGVYPQKSPDGTTEYCVSGTCSNLCDSTWHKNVVKEIKDSVCCGRMKLEPQTGNGKCTEPKAMDSTKIGVHFPEVKLGCSVTPAGGGVNYCEVPSSSSSSSFDDVQSSSSYEDAESSSSGEGEGDSGSDIECSADVGNALSKLHSKKRRCEQEGGIPDFSEYSGCVYGSCLPPSSSSSEEMSSSSEEQSSSSSNLEEDVEYGDCPAPPAPFKPQSLMSPKELPLGGYYQHEQVLYNIKGQQVQTVTGGSAVMEYLAREGLLENPEIYFEEELNIPFALKESSEELECGIKRKDYGIVEADGSHTGGIACAYVIPEYKYAPNTKNPIFVKKCDDGTKMYNFKEVTKILINAKWERNSIHYVEIGFKYSDGHKTTKEEYTRIKKHEEGHQRHFKCLKFTEFTIKMLGCLCESHTGRIINKEIEKASKIYKGMIESARDQYHNKYGNDGFPEHNGCP